MTDLIVLVYYLQDRMNIYRANLLGRRGVPDPEGPAPDLSIQQVIDCTTTIFGTGTASNDPCQGSLLSDPMYYVIGSPARFHPATGLVSDAAYPYAAAFTGGCQVDTDPALADAARYFFPEPIGSLGLFGANPSVLQIKTALEQGPIAVGYKIYADAYVPDNPALPPPGGGSQWRDAVYDTPAEPECAECSDCAALYPKVARYKLMACDAGRCYINGHAVEMVGWGTAATGAEYVKQPLSGCNARRVGRPSGGHGTAATPSDGHAPLLGSRVVGRVTSVPISSC